MKTWLQSSVWNHVLRDHVIIGAAAALALVPVWGAKISSLFWVASILIDVDHYLDFLHRTGGKFWRLKDMLAFHAHLFPPLLKQNFLCVDIFHTAEFFALAGWLATRVDTPEAWGIFCGFVFHLFVDYAHLLRHGVFRKRANSLIEYWVRCRQMKKAGIAIHEPYKIALANLMAQKT